MSELRPPGEAEGGKEKAIDPDASTAEASATGAEDDQPTGGKRGGRASRIVRATAVVLLMTIGALLVTLSVPAIWGRNLVLNTDRYVSTLAPLSSDPGIQAGIVKAIDKQFDENVDIKGLVQSVLPPKAAPLANPIQSAADSFVNTVATKFVASAAFSKAWVEINRVAHAELVSVLTGTGSDKNAVDIKNDKVQINIAPIIMQVKTQLVSAGLSVASKVPVVSTTIEIAQVKGIDKARHGVRVLNKVAHWLPVIGLLCLLGAVLLSRRRRRGTIIAALSVAFGMTLIAIGLAVGRNIYLNSLPGIYLTRDAAGSLFDTLVHYLRLGLRWVLVGALLVCLIALFTGPSAAARKLRSIPRTFAKWWTGTRLAGGLSENRGVAAGAVFGVAALVLVLWTNPTLLVVLVIAILTAVLCLLIYATKGARPAVPVIRQG